MKQIPIIGILAAGLILTSCAKKTPQYVHSIPDNAVAVMTLHPLQIHTKGQLNTLHTLKEKLRDEVWSMLLEDPMSSGLMLDEYVYVFVKMEDDAPVIGVVSGMQDPDKFEAVLGKIRDDVATEFTEKDSYTLFKPDEEGAVAWNGSQMVILGSPDADEFDPSYWDLMLDWMFDPVREESITSLVDFKDFMGGMKDLNFWVSSDDMRRLIERASPSEMEIDIPIDLYNNYARAYCDFAKGAVYVTGETHFSEEVEKNLEEFLVMKPALNEEMLELTPGGDLLMALAGSMDLDKLQKLVRRFSPPKLDEAGNQIESITGVPTDELIQAFNGDFAISVNGVEGGSTIPVEIFIGLGVKSEAIQQQLMQGVQTLVPVEEEGDFFIINFQGNEIYSGILQDMWVLTNAKGYREALEGGSLDRSLMDSRFTDYAGGSVGMYLNLDMETYPSMVQGILRQNRMQHNLLTKFTSSFESLGITAGNYESYMTLKTSEPSENSLHTIMKMTEDSR